MKQQFIVATLLVAGASFEEVKAMTLPDFKKTKLAQLAEDSGEGDESSTTNELEDLGSAAASTAGYDWRTGKFDSDNKFVDCEKK